MNPSGVVGAVLRGWRQVRDLHHEVATSRWRREIRRAARDDEDTLRALVLLDTLGVESPVAYETLDAVPYVLGDLHAWHRRTGRRDMDWSGLCC